MRWANKRDAADSLWYTKLQHGETDQEQRCDTHSEDVARPIATEGSSGGRTVAVGDDHVAIEVDGTAEADGEDGDCDWGSPLINGASKGA